MNSMWPVGDNAPHFSLFVSGRVLICVITVCWAECFSSIGMVAMIAGSTFRLSDETQNEIRRRTGLSVRELAGMDPADIAEHIGSCVKKKLRFDSFSDVTEALGRGQVYPFAGRLISEEEIDRGLR